MKTISQTQTDLNPNLTVIMLNNQQKVEDAKIKKPEKKLHWKEDTIDNEHMNKLKSNICCIFHSKDESSDDTCTSDDDTNGIERSRETKAKHKLVCSKFKNKHQHHKKCKHHDHDHKNIE